MPKTPFFTYLKGLEFVDLIFVCCVGVFVSYMWDGYVSSFTLCFFICRISSQLLWTCVKASTMITTLVGLERVVSVLSPFTNDAFKLNHPGSLYLDSRGCARFSSTDWLNDNVPSRSLWWTLFLLLVSHLLHAAGTNVDTNQHNCIWIFNADCIIAVQCMFDNPVNHAPAFYRARWLAKVTRRV